ncbi:diguanylate cyclase [Lysinibacillus sp. NPDC097195]|uniref:sensor domain-containing diguanylate cyclase n=1 Tax=Lysinibacillus sp. NPDC097195 TaxID=3364141 RepID=UPI0038060AE3
MQNKLVKSVIILSIMVAIFGMQLLFPLTSHATELAKPIVLGKHYDIFRDPSKSIAIEDILSGQYDQSFEKSTDNYLFFWHTKDTIWLRLNVGDIIQDKQASYWFESVDKLDNIEMYLVKDDGSYTVQKSGIAHIKEQKIHYRSNLFTITDPTITEIYVKLDGALPISLISYLSTTDSFIEKTISYKFFVGIFYGFMLALLIYNLFLFFSLKEKAYFYYVLYMCSFIFYQATMNSLDIEIAGQFLPEWFFLRSLVIGGNLLLIFMILFSTEFLELKKYLPKFYLIARGLLWVAILSLIAVFFIPNVAIVNNFTTIFAVALLSFLWLCGLLVWLKGQKMARFYLVGWTVLLGSVIVQALAFLSILPFHPRIFEDVPAIGATFEAIFLSLALGDKINLIKKEHQEMQLVLTETLEHKVQERTQELEKAKQELENIANTDKLTQIPNRVRLDYVLDEALTLAHQQATPLSIILLDIDYFKAVNDEFGHQVGDLVLVNAAALFKDSIRAQDTLGRWGGEEFLVICPETTLQEAVQLAETLRQRLENHTFPIVQRKTSSFGVAAYIQDDNVTTMLTRCDQALYQAKNNGRNCVAYVEQDNNSFACHEMALK